MLRALHGAPRASVPVRVRLLLNRAGTAEVQTSRFEASHVPLRVAVAAEPVDSGDPLLFHKTTRRAIYEERRASRPDCDDVLLVNGRGELTESAIANPVVRLNGAHWTPPMECGLLPGVLRADLLARGEIRERILRPEDLRSAEGIYLINSVRGWRRVELAPQLRGGARPPRRRDR